VRASFRRRADDKCRRSIDLHRKAHRHAMVPAFRTCTPKGPSGNKGQVSGASVTKKGMEEKGNVDFFVPRQPKDADGKILDVGAQRDGRSRRAQQCGERPDPVAELPGDFWAGSGLAAFSEIEPKSDPPQATNR